MEATRSATAQIPGPRRRFLGRSDTFKGDKIDPFRILLLNVSLNDSISLLDAPSPPLPAVENRQMGVRLHAASFSRIRSSLARSALRSHYFPLNPLIRDRSRPVWRREFDWSGSNTCAEGRVPDVAQVPPGHELTPKRSPGGRRGAIRCSGALSRGHYSLLVSLPRGITAGVFHTRLI